MFTILTLFLFWTIRGEEMNMGNKAVVMAIGSIILAIFFAFICFIRFIRSRSITGGLFLSTCISTGIFFATSQFIPVLMSPALQAFSVDAASMQGNNMQLIIVLAQVGLFGIWFAFILFTIFLYVQPVKRIDKYLTKIINGEEIKKVRIGNARQYKAISKKIKQISEACPQVEFEENDNRPQDDENLCPEEIDHQDDLQTTEKNY